MRHRTLVVAAAAAVALLPACATDEPEVSAGPEPAEQAPAPDASGGSAAASFMGQAAQNTVAAPAFEFSMTLATEGLDGVASGTVMSADGVFTSDATRGSMTMTIDIADMLGADAGDLGDLGGLLDGLSEPWQIVVDGDTTYLSGGMFGSFLGADTEWISVTVDDAGFDPAAGSIDPTQLLDLLDDAGDVSEVGVDDIDGATATHYVVDVDVAGVAAEAGAGGLDELGAFGDGAVTVDVWVDDAAQQVRRLQIGIDGGAIDLAGADGTMVLTLDITPLDATVEVDVPDPAEVTPMEGLVPDLGGFGGLGG